MLGSLSFSDILGTLVLYFAGLVRFAMVTLLGRCILIQFIGPTEFIDVVDLMASLFLIDVIEVIEVIGLIDLIESLAH